MMRAATLAGLAIGIAAAGIARAEPPSIADRPGFDLGLRVGYALPFGEVTSGNAVDEGFSSLVPLVLEAGYRIHRSVTVGAFFQYAIAQIANEDAGCSAGSSCSGRIIRVGAQAIYRLPVPSSFVPWVGFGAGYEWLTLKFSAGPDSFSGTLRGFEFGTLQVGADYRVSPEFCFGPFGSYSVARFDTASMTQTVAGVPMTQSDPITDKAFHEWLQVGIRGTFNL